MISPENIQTELSPSAPPFIFELTPVQYGLCTAEMPIDCGYAGNNVPVMATPVELEQFNPLSVNLQEQHLNEAFVDVCGDIVPQEDICESDSSSTVSSVACISACNMEDCCYGGGEGTGDYYKCSKCDNIYVCMKCYGEGGHRRHKKYMNMQLNKYG